MSSYNLDMLNRLRVNAGKSELKSWKASKALLRENIEKLQSEGFTDALPGANVDATPILPPDPQLAEAFKKDEVQLSEEDKKQIKDEAKDRPVTKVRSGLARGAENGHFTEHSRKSVQDQRAKEKKEAKEERKKQKQLAKGEVDAKKEPEKAARQKKHIEEKRAKREKEGKLKPTREKNADEVTVADIARDIGLNPKIARAKLRRYEGKEGYPDPVKGERWTFPKTARKALEKILNKG